jgi:hypothetical protein
VQRSTSIVRLDQDPAASQTAAEALAHIVLDRL